MNIRKHQARRFSVRWLKYNRKYWAPWVIKSAEVKAKEYAEYFSRADSAGGGE